MQNSETTVSRARHANRHFVSIYIQKAENNIGAIWNTLRYIKNTSENISNTNSHKVKFRLVDE